MSSAVIINPTSAKRLDCVNMVSKCKCYVIIIKLIPSLCKLIRVRCISAVALFIICTILVWHAYINVIEWQFFNDHYTRFQYKLSSKICDIPNEDPFDKTIQPYIEYRKPLNCNNFQPDLTYLDYNGVLSINQSVLSQFKLRSDFLTCYYRTLVRKEGNDRDIIYDPENVLNVSVKLPQDREFVAVRCKYKASYIYHDNHFYVPGKKVGVRIHQNIPVSKPQVFILVIESLSRLNAIRHLPKTYAYLTKVMKSEILKGLTKVADNSFGNMVPFLTGHKAYAEIPELPGNENKGPYDNWPFIWKNFSKVGYVTALTEDNPDYTLFNYLADGFLKQPTNYYTRPFWISLSESPLDKLNKKFCFGNTATYNIFFNWIKEFVIKYSKKLYFLFSFYISIAHNDFNDAQYLDSDLFEMLKELNENEHFENSIVIVMGDHGSRFDKLLKTKIGQIELRMPLFSITLPSFLEKQHPHLRKYLKKNSKRLTTWFDIHSLLTDIATSTYQISEAKHVWNTRGYSPWRMDIPINRTCKTAGVPHINCICQKEVNIEPDDPRSVEASFQLIYHMNTMLETVQPFCMNLSLGMIIKAVVLLPSEDIANKGYSLKIRLQVSLKPSNGVFEAVLEKTPWSKFEVLGDINRFNKYGNQSACIKHRVLRKFCYCKGVKLSL